MYLVTDFLHSCFKYRPKNLLIWQYFHSSLLSILADVRIIPQNRPQPVHFTSLFISLCTATSPFHALQTIGVKIVFSHNWHSATNWENDKT